MDHESQTRRYSLTWAARLEKRVTTLDRMVGVWQQKLDKFRNARLTAGIVFFVALVVLTARPQLRLEIPVLLAFLALFLYLVSRTRKIDRFTTRLIRLRTFHGRQALRAKGKPSGRDGDAVEVLARDLPIIRDIGLLGSHSLWTLLDETLTDRGAAKLLGWMHGAPRDRAAIEERSSRVRSIRNEAWFYTRLALEAGGGDEAAEFRVSASQILDFMKKPFTEGRFNLALIGNLLAWVLMVVGILYATSGHAPAYLNPTYFGMFFAFTSLVTLGQIGSPFLRGVGLSHHLGQLAPIFEALEARLQTSETLQAICPVTKNEGPSRGARRLNRVLSFLGVQANPLLYLVINAILPWTIVATYFLERRRRKLAATFPACLDELAELEALGSLVILDRFQTRTYATLSSATHPVLIMRAGFHPLIDREKVVPNDFGFPTKKSLGLLTGSNMSGKSTFLRTIGLNQTLANMGAPVFADHYEASPLEIETCIEVSDSLRDGFSYFYAEVRRLRHILEAAARGTPVLFLIDEIFRGTNNRERQIGSRAVIKALARTPHAIGFISTHDLELTTLETNSPSLLNLHFREDLDEKGAMAFSYHLRQGPCPTTNALIIMAAEGLPVDLAYEPNDLRVT